MADLTMRVYARLRPDDERRARAVLPDILPDDVVAASSESSGSESVARCVAFRGGSGEHSGAFRSTNAKREVAPEKKKPRASPKLRQTPRGSYWRGRRDSNPQPPDRQSGTLTN